MKQILSLIFLTIVLTACGSSVTNSGPVSCTTKQTASGSTTTCPDGSSSTVVNGTNGTNGSSCSVTSLGKTVQTPNGGSLISCQDGTQSLVLNGTPGTNGTNGTNGSNGANGSNGSNGSNGTNGTNGTVVTPVQFCSADKASYPNTFPEVGFCIAGQLYAVYSANDGFLSLITPGTYTSNGINSSCTFTVSANCAVK